MIIHEEELAKIPDLHAKALHYVFENNMISDMGMWLEFGVYNGGTINRMSKYTNKNIIFGFDSFYGLPEEWTGRSGGPWPAGSFDLHGRIPWVAPNIKLYPGWYKDTIPQYVNDYPKSPITFLHVDSDIYSSAKEIFSGLGEYLIDGAIIVFDELVDYSSFEIHEWKAWWEFVDANGVSFNWIGGNRSRSVPQNLIRTKTHPNQVFFDEDRTDYSPKNNISPAWENVALRIVHNPIAKIKL